MAPELLVLHQDRPNISADVFSFGRLTLFVVAGVLPFDKIRSLEIEKRLKRRQLPPLQWPNREDPLARHLQPVEEHCCWRQAALRPTIQEVGDWLETMSEDLAAAPQPGRNESGKLEAFDGLVQARTAAPHLRQITPSAGAALAPVPEHDSTAGMARAWPAASVRDDRMVYPDFVITPMSTQVSSTLWLIMQWNIHIPAEECCPFHAALLSLKAVHAQLSSMTCKNIHGVKELVGQCPSCGIVFEETECFFCGGEVTGSHSVSSSFGPPEVNTLAI